MPSPPAIPARPRSGVPAALSVAVCAAFAANAAHGTPILIDIPDLIVTGGQSVDFNGDGIAEFTFGRSSASIGDFTFDAVSVDTGGNAVVQSTKGTSYAAALGGGETIDATRTFTSGSSVVLAKFPSGLADFDDVGTAYLGVRFTIPTDGAAHFGWVEVVNDGSQIILTRLFWDSGERVPATTPGQSVPEPGSLALMIAGAAGILAMRRRRRPATDA